MNFVLWVLLLLLSLVSAAVYQLAPVAPNNDLRVVVQHTGLSCSLIGIFNILILRRQVAIGASISAVSDETMLEKCTEFLQLRLNDILERDVEGKAEIAQEILQTIDALPSFTNGVMADPDFRGPAEFSDKDHMPTYFSAFDIPVYHLLVPNTEDPYQAEILQLGDSYEEMQRSWTSEFETLNDRNRMIAAPFLDSLTHCHATRHGMALLQASMTSGRYSLLFLRDHYMVIYAYEDMNRKDRIIFLDTYRVTGAELKWTPLSQAINPVF
ncbi:MAG: hypothetical protein SGCHY_003413 [Lobulomycetales sp.]